jgi:hypothetical protein
MKLKKACYLCTYAFCELDEKPCEQCIEYCNFDRRYKKYIKVKGDLAMEKIEEDVQFLLALKMVMKHDVKDKIKMQKC